MTGRLSFVAKRSLWQYMALTPAADDATQSVRAYAADMIRNTWWNPTERMQIWMMEAAIYRPGES